MARLVQVARYTADGTQVTREMDKIGDAGEKMANRVKRGADSMSPALRGIDAAAGVAHTKVQNLASSTGSLGTVLTAMGPAGLAAAAGIGVLTLGFVALQRAAIDAMRQVADIDGVAQQLGVATDFVQEFRFAVTGTGGDIAIADSALLSFSRNLGQLNTDLGKRARGALEELGFSDEEIRNMRNVEEALPRIIDRISQVGDASAQAAIAQKLGLDSVLETLQAGGDGFEELRRQARESGFVLDSTLIARMAELEDRFKLAQLQIDANFAASLAELAPLFVSLSETIADASVQLTDFLRNLGLLDRQSRGFAERRLAEIRTDLGEMFEGMSDEQIGGLTDRVLGANFLIGRDARLRGLLDERAELLRTLRDLGPETSGAPARPPSGGDPAAVDTATQQLRAFVEQLEAEARVRARVNELLQDTKGARRDEAQAIVTLEADLRKLQEARDAGVIASDAELARLEALRRSRDEEAAAIRRQEAELQRLRAIEASNDGLRRQTQTPEQRIQEEIIGLEKAAARGERNPELVAARIRQLREEYDALAESQYEASLQGQLLAQVIQGQIRNFDDLKRTLLALLADAALREFFAMAGGGSSDGGFWGMFGRILGRVGVNLGGGGAAPAGGGRAGGGALFVGARHQTREMGPELGLLWGPGEVAPKAAVDGLAVLSKLARAAQAPAAGGSARTAPVTVNINNQSGTDVDASAETSMGQDGALMLDVVLTRKVSGDLATGKLDDAMRGRYGARGPLIRRG